MNGCYLPLTTLTNPKDAERDNQEIMTLTTTSFMLCCQPWSYLMGHEPHLPTPSHLLLQNLVGWSTMTQLKLYPVSGSAWSKGKRCESGSQSSKSRTQKPGNGGTRSPELLYLQRLAHSSHWFWTLRNITAPACQSFWITAHTELNRRVCQPTAQESKI